jgi:hypothetical protein
LDGNNVVDELLLVYENDCRGLGRRKEVKPLIKERTKDEGEESLSRALIFDGTGCRKRFWGCEMKFCSQTGRFTGLACSARRE